MRESYRFIAKPFLLIAGLVLASSAGAQTLPTGATSKYDRFKDDTFVSLTHTERNLSVATSFFFPGKKVTKDVDDFFLTFTATARCRGLCFDNPELIFLVDGERVGVGTNRNYGTRAIFFIDRDLFKRLGSALKVEYQVGRYEGVWTGKILDDFKALLALASAK